MPSGKVDLDKVITRILQNKNNSKAGEILREINSNNEYIREVQLAKLLKYHDNSFKNSCVGPTARLYKKYQFQTLQLGDLQKQAEILDRDIRVIEVALECMRAEENQAETNN